MSSTPRAVALGVTIRQLRRETKLSLRELADRIDRDFPTLSRWETGERIPKPQHVTHILAALGVNGTRFRRVMRLCDDLDHPTWIATTDEEHHVQRDAYLALATVATHVTELAPRAIPPLLRTREVATAIAQAGEVPADQAVAHVTALRERQRILLNQKTTELTILLGAAALDPPVGEIGTIAQLEYLLRLTEHPRIDLRLTPADPDGNPDQPFTLTRTHNATLAVTHTRRSTLWLHRREELDNLADDIRAARANALSADDSTKTITEALRQLRADTTRDLVRAG
ncbi:Scr1 family TA system antitoxin-like transcriptional regulator [Actinokineospora enzanensis]|uniref:Scr1 family TA system antitoxin-like transcriptional regulator n=1 Tax=Actinokineospora enzanensis TaxID=155975 RepID=UPI00035F0355|nr:Scr1 family TA system antitoxin-like transcriptional regulator [Actinokineospora enzanensis]